MKERFRISLLIVIIGSFPFLALLIAPSLSIRKVVLLVLLGGLLTAVFLLVSGLRKIPFWLISISILFLTFLLVLWLFQNWNLTIIWPFLLLAGVLVLTVSRLAFDISNWLASVLDAEKYRDVLGKFPPLVSSPIGQELVNREMTRSRRYERPLSFIVFDTLTETENPNSGLNQAPESVSQLLFQSRLAETMQTQLQSLDVLLRMQNPDRFLILSPEVAKAETQRFGLFLAHQVAEICGRQPKMAVVSFPEDGLTFNGMMETAISQLTACERKAQCIDNLINESSMAE